MKVKVNWDTDNYPLEECNLKEIVDIPNDIDADDIADYLSDEYGYLVESFEILEKNDIMISLDEACEILESMLYTHDCGDYDIVATPYDTIEEVINNFRKTFEKP